LRLGRSGLYGSSLSTRSSSSPRAARRCGVGGNRASGSLGPPSGSDLHYQASGSGSVRPRGASSSPSRRRSSRGVSRTGSGLSSWSSLDRTCDVAGGVHTAATRRLPGLACAYAGFSAATIPLSLAYGVGARPGGRAMSDMPFRGTGFTPPLFLPVLLVGGALGARSRDLGSYGAGLVAAVSTAILGGSTLNVPNDVRAVRAAGGPASLTYGLARASAILALALLGHSVAAVISAGSDARSAYPAQPHAKEETSWSSLR
jgi:hypothetical protein